MIAYRLCFTSSESTLKTASRRAVTHGVITRAMTRLLRKSAALIAVYSIALQALLLGFAAPGHFGFDPFEIICSADGSGGHDPSLPQHRSDCDACLPAFNSPSAVVPPGVLFSPAIFSDLRQRLTFLIEPLSPQRRHQPQESRAPPIAS